MTPAPHVLPGAQPAPLAVLHWVPGARQGTGVGWRPRRGGSGQGHHAETYATGMLARRALGRQVLRSCALAL